MLKIKQKLNQSKHDDLASRIRSLQAECESLIDAEAEKMRQPGVPINSVRALLTAHYPGNPFLAALYLLEKDID